MSPTVDDANGNGSAARWRDRVAARGRRGWQRVRRTVWSLVQGTAAAAIAWQLALLIGDHPDPFFAPIAAVIALNASFGERGLNALRLLLGVIIGILAGEATLLVLEDGPGSLAVATFVAMIVARGLGESPLVVAQAAAAAILTVAVGDGQVGPDRMVDAVTGAGVALVFSQFLFTPRPLRLLHRAESAVLSGMADGLSLAARASVDADEEAGQDAVHQLREMPKLLLALNDARGASGRIARRTLAGRVRSAAVVQEQQSADQLGLLGISCVMLTRAVLATEPEGSRPLIGAVDQITGFLTELADAPADAEVRRAVVDRVPALLQDLRTSAADFGSSSQVALRVTFRVVVVDLMVFAGVDTEDATTTVSKGAPALQAPPPPRAARSRPGLLTFLSKLLPRNWRAKRNDRT